MASAAKTTASTLLIIGLVLGGLGAFLPAGDNWTQTDDVRETEVFTLFTYTLRVTSGDTVVRETGPIGWSHDRLAGDTGTGAMNAAGIVAVVALLLAVVGTILSIPGRTVRGGGMVAMLGAMGLATATALAVTGMRERTEAVLGTPDALDPRIGLFLLGGAFLLMLVGAVIAASPHRQGVARPTPPDPSPWRDHPANVGARNAAAQARQAAPHTLRCPDCGTTTRVPTGIVPTCASCGFHRRDPAPAGLGHDDAFWAA